MINSSLFIATLELIAKIATGASYEEIKSCLEKGCDVNIHIEKIDKAPLDIAVIRGNLDIVELLIQYGAKIENKWDFSPLVTACHEDSPNFEIIEFLLQNGADPNIKHETGITLLVYAASIIQNPDIVKFLLKYADPAIKTSAKISGRKHQMSPLFYVLCLTNDQEMSRDYREIIKLIIDRGVNLNEKLKIRDSICTPLSTALYNSINFHPWELEIPKYLLQKGANPNEKIYVKSKCKDGKNRNYTNVYQIVDDYYNFFKIKSAKDEEFKKTAHYVVIKDQMEEFISLLNQYRP